MKSHLKSKTHWFNTIMGTMAILAISPVIPIEWAAYFGLIQTLGNYWFRAITNQGLSMNPEMEAES